MTATLKKESKILVKHSMVYGLGTVLNRVVAFILLPIYTQFLTPHDYGVKELVALTTEVIGILLATAISSSIYRFYFEYDSEKDRKQVISSAIITIGGIGACGVIAASLFSYKLSDLILDNSELYYLFLISFISMWFQSINAVAFDYLRAKQQSTRFIIFSVGKLILALSLNIYTVCILKIGVLGILLSTLISSVVVSGILLVPILITIGFHFSKDKIVAMLKYGLPLIPSQFGAFIVHLSDRFFIKAYCSISDAGIYSLGYRIGALPSNFISGPFNQTWMPRRFEMYKQDGAEKVFGQIFTYFLALMFFAGLVVSISAKEILMIIADQGYWSAYKIVPIIVMATTIFSLHYHFNMGILIKKKTKILSYINLSNSALILCLNYFAIPKYGIYGAAYATLIAFIYKVSLTYYFSKKYYSVHFEFKRIFQLLVTTILLYIILSFISLGIIWLDLFAKLAGTLCFPFLLYLFGFFSIKEKEKIRTIISQFLISLFNKKERA
jgi:O-antigen/teichoic acid export membrane protein